jgi:hypothetical protein
MNFLRPIYTDLLFKNLQKKSLNVYAPRGQGQLRLLENLQQLASDKGNQVFLLNMKDHAQCYEGFIQEFARQVMRFKADFDRHDLRNLADIFKALDQLALKGLNVLLLHDFDAILNNPQIDFAYDLEFFRHLNSLKNRGHRLVCITEQPHTKMMVYINGTSHSNSRLDLDKKPLPPLTDAEIRQELLNRHFKADYPHFNDLIEAIQRHPQSYEFLEFSDSELKLNKKLTVPFKKRLKKLHGDFEEREKNSPSKNFYNVKKSVSRWSILTGFNKLKIPFVVVIVFVEELIRRLFN